MTRIKQQVRTFLVGLAIVVVGSVAGTTVSDLMAPAPAVAHVCGADECGSFLIFWERCEDNPGQATGCKMDGGDCVTVGCGHK